MGYFATSEPAARKRATGVSFAPLKTLTPGSRLQGLGLRFDKPPIGRWLSRDPIGEDGGHNLYSCVRNSPPDTFDAHGLAITATAYVTDYHGTVEAKTPSFAYLPSYIDSDGSGPGVYDRPAASIVGGISGAMYASMRGRTKLSALPWYLPGVVKLQLSSFIYGKLTICGCCEGNLVNVDWKIQARITAPGQISGARSSTATFGSHNVTATPSSSPQYQTGTDTYALPANGCTEINFDVGQGWIDHDTAGSGTSAKAMVVAHPYCP